MIWYLLVPLIVALAMWLGRCRHEAAIRVHRGRWSFECPDCGKVWPMNPDSGPMRMTGRYDEQKAVRAKLRADIEADQRRILAAKRAMPEPKNKKAKNVIPMRQVK